MPAFFLLTYPTMPFQVRARTLMPQARPLVLAAALAPLFAVAQTPAATALDPVIVTGTREPQRLSASAADVVLIDADTVRDSGADSVEDLLRRVAGLQIARNGAPGQSSGYLVRGANTNSTVVLVDGVRIGSATLGQASFETMSLSQIERIEVLRGPASSLYGADAVGGVIQIFTHKGTAGSPRVTGNAAVGGKGSHEGSLGVSGAQGAFDYAASVAHEASDGVSAVREGDLYGYAYPDADGFTRKVGTVRVGFAPVAGHRVGLHASETRLNAQYDSADFDPVTFAPDNTGDFRNRLTNRVVALDYRGVVSPLWTTSAQVARNTDDSNSGAATLSRYKTERDQATWQNALHLTDSQQLVLAYEHLREQVSGDVYADEPSRTNHALVGGWTGRFGPTSLEGSLRHDDNSAYGTSTTGSLGVSFALTKEWKLRALAGTTFRAPTFNELYFPGYGVDTIAPERGRSVEVGAAWQAGASRASLTVYRNKVRDLIGYEPNLDGSSCPVGYTSGCAANTARATLQGATLNAGQRWGDLSVLATVDLLDATDDDTGERLSRRAAHQESLAADYDLGAWTLGASVLQVGSRPDNGVTLGGYAVVDLRATWRFLPQWRLEARLLNAADRDVEPVRDYRGVGRQAWIGVRFDTLGF